MSLKHFSHDHPLGFVTRQMDPGYCGMCGLRQYSVEIYICNKCPSFFIHKSCAKLLPEINHPFHPQHPLTFLASKPRCYDDDDDDDDDDAEELQCSACGEISSGSTYHCSLCKFDLDINCASLMPITTTESINHYIGEPHPLILCDTEREADFHCLGCGETIRKDLICVCLECKILLDISCAQLPKEIRNHPFHPDHTLTCALLSGNNSEHINCYACSSYCSGFFFHCFECDQFSLDLQCSFLMPIKTISNNVGHSHPLFLCENTNKYSTFSCACLTHVLDDDSILCCLECNLLLHKHCAELPIVIEHVFHRLHPLKLRLYSWNDCNSCLKSTKGGSSYVCDDCEFAIDVSCALSTVTPQTLRSRQLHRHPLAFFSLVKSDLFCTLCNLSSAANFFRCVECDFNVHLLCIPELPRVVSDGNHRHVLTLTETPVKDREDEDDNAEFLCDRCEKERRLYDPTYYCAKCHYVAHIQCVLPEVIRLLEEECSFGQKLGDKHEVMNKALTTDMEGTMSEKLNANKLSILYSVAEIHEEIVALRAEVEEQESKAEASLEELKPFLEKFPQFADLFTE